ncbi:hypothetical protein ALC60_00837, partial [Trachymyrmex zeteki]
VRKCLNCARWGHISRNCKGKLTCPSCGGNHSKDNCNTQTIKCVNCSKDHNSFDLRCHIFKKLKLINTICAYANVDRRMALKFIKQQNIKDIKDALRTCHSMAYA